jgi:tRNA(Ile)-lysidine synthase
MLAALAPLAGERGFVLRCFHVEHGIRPASESRADAEAVKALASRFNIPWKVLHIPPGRIARYAREQGCGIEAAARYFRHRAFNRERRRIGAARVLIAHTADDSLENTLMGFLRGGGPAGLAAMPSASPFSKGRILRPLIKVGRRDIINWLSEQNIPFQSDSTNADTSLLRNRVRLLLVPQLDALFPAWRKTVLSLAETQRLAADLLSAEAGRDLPWEWGGDGAFLSAPRGRFLAAPALVREEALFRGADLISIKSKAGPGADAVAAKKAKPRREVLRRFAEALGKPASAGERVVAADMGPFRGEIRGERVLLRAAKRGGGERGFSLLIEKRGAYSLAGALFFVGVDPTGSGGEDETAPYPSFDACLPLILRSPLPGDWDSFKPSANSSCADSNRANSSRADSNRANSSWLARRRVLGYTELISACDCHGIAAIIGVCSGRAEIAARREGSSFESISVALRPKNKRTGKTDAK